MAAPAGAQVIFVDTGAFVARYRKSDDWHLRAKRAWAQLADGRHRLFTSSQVIAEAARLMLPSIGADRLADLLSGWLSSSVLEVLRGDADQEIEALAFLRKFADQPIGFVDCLSFVQMRRRQIRRAFTFDRHFRMAGFEMWSGDRS